MSDRGAIVLERDRHFKWRAFDALELVLMVLCGISIAGFSSSGKASRWTCSGMNTKATSKKRYRSPALSIALAR